VIAVAFTYQTSCFATLRNEVQLPVAGSGKIVITATEPCDCPLFPAVPQTFQGEIGPLPPGTYAVEARWEKEEGALCAPGKLLGTTALIVSRTGSIVNLRTEPANPVSGQPVAAKFEAFCPMVFKEPVFVPSGEETLILIDENSEAPQPGAPCLSQPEWAYSFALAPLLPRTYRIRVRLEEAGVLQTEAETVFTVGSAGPVLTLRGGRFHIRANWNAPGFGQGSAQAVQLTDESGYFTFFDPNNVELIVKVLQGCPVNQRYWVFMAGLTNVGVTIFVEDTLTGHQENYANPVGRPFQPVLDTLQFATCP
jgi:hypothetical protein